MTKPNTTTSSENILYFIPVLEALKLENKKFKKKQKIYLTIIIIINLLMICGFIPFSFAYVFLLVIVSFITYVCFYVIIHVNYSTYAEFIIRNTLFLNFKDFNITFSASDGYNYVYKSKINIPIFKKACELLNINYCIGTFKNLPIRISELTLPGYCLKKSLFISVQTKSTTKKTIIIANKSFLDKGINKFNEIFIPNREFNERYYIQTEEQIYSPDFSISSDLINKLIAIDKKGIKIAICKHFDNFDIIVDNDKHIFRLPIDKLDNIKTFHQIYPYLEESTKILKEISQLINILNRENFIPKLEYENVLKEYTSLSEKKTQENNNHFAQLFDEKLIKSLKYIEIDRKQALTNSIPMTLFFGLLPFVFSIFMLIDLVKYFNNREPISQILGISIFLIFATIFGLILPVHTINQYKKGIKGKLYDFLFSYFGDFECLSNEPTGRNWDYYKTIPLFKNYNTSPYIDDRFKGIYNGILVNIEELKLEALNGKVFDGLLFYFPYQHKKCYSTIISTNKKFPYSAKPFARIKLEDIEFEKIYETYSNDQIEARYILTTAFMEKLKRLDKHNIKAAVCFHDGMVYIGVKTTKNLFEPPLFKSALDIENYKSLINQMKEILEIIDILEMDRKTLL